MTAAPATSHFNFLIGSWRLEHHRLLAPLDRGSERIAFKSTQEGFIDGVGTFYGRETFGGQTVAVRFLWTGITDTTAMWRQHFSFDGGTTWEENRQMRPARARLLPCGPTEVISSLAPGTCVLRCLGHQVNTRRTKSDGTRAWNRSLIEFTNTTRGSRQRRGMPSASSWTVTAKPDPEVRGSPSFWYSRSHRLQPLRQGQRVTVVAAGCDAVATGRGVPGSSVHSMLLFSAMAPD